MKHEVRQNMIEAVQGMHDYLVAREIPEPQDGVVFYILQDLDELVEATIGVRGGRVETARRYWEGGSTARAGKRPERPSYIILNSGSDWFASAPREHQMKVAAHELYHAYQTSLSGLRSGSPEDTVPESGPRWLNEGSAEFSAYRSMSDIGVLSYEAERGRLVEGGKRADRPLSEIEKQEGFRAVRDSYKYSLLAAELLASYAGEEGLIHYYKLTQPGTTWQAAFKAAFGMTVEEFYELFEEHRAVGFPKMHIPTLQATMPGAPSYVRWEIGDEVTEEEVQYATEAVQLMHDYTVSLGLPETSEDITVYLYRNLNALRSAYAREKSISIEDSRNIWSPDRPQGRGGEGYAFVNMGTPWVQSDYPYHLFRIVAGEFNHPQKREWSELRLSSAGNVVPEAGPRWLNSGPSSILVTLVGDAAGLRSYDERREWLVNRTKRHPMEQPLSTMETRVGFEASGRFPYSYSALAAELLASHTGVSSLFQYYVNHKRGTPWQETFTDTFGMTVDEFYDLFEEHRAAGFPKLDIPKSMD